MMPWNFDMSQAPIGGEVTTTQRAGNGDINVTRYVAPTVIAAGPSEGFVGLTKWDNKRGAWMYFSKDAPPIAWMPMPDHPHEVAK